MIRCFYHKGGTVSFSMSFAWDEEKGRMRKRMLKTIKN
jgi:hypothetical protein